jgi:hypothetical protein
MRHFGSATNVYRRTATANDARRIARRFLRDEDMILRFITHPGLDIFTKTQAERAIKPVKVQQRSSGRYWRTLESGEYWRTLDSLADFAVVRVEVLWSRRCWRSRRVSKVADPLTVRGRSASPANPEPICASATAVAYCRLAARNEVSVAPVSRRGAGIYRGLGRAYLRGRVSATVQNSAAVYTGFRGRPG